ncbi:uncharacterized protein UV8b_00161 [Ustilaginoidea virens]|uniref:Uncharacterized protein n=1 Tax=Ustilaginoidea virens TaxID=1159556 RepID=A0A8E5HI87_USTVR|nr:uncharacterized protein UV8b_00161 [Ustilaginoidea virens]QUC15920.1 hypothetical protein UV8b_00161 [Ustilaginoidea virens]
MHLTARRMSTFRSLVRPPAASPRYIGLALDPSFLHWFLVYTFKRIFPWAKSEALGAACFDLRAYFLFSKLSLHSASSPVDNTSTFPHHTVLY